MQKVSVISYKQPCYTCFQLSIEAILHVCCKIKPILHGLLITSLVNHYTWSINFTFSFLYHTSNPSHMASPMPPWALLYTVLHRYSGLVSSFTLQTIIIFPPIINITTGPYNTPYDCATTTGGPHGYSQGNHQGQQHSS